MTPDPPLQCPCGDTCGPFARTPHGWTCEDCLAAERQTTTQEPQ